MQTVEDTSVADLLGFDTPENISGNRTGGVARPVPPLRSITRLPADRPGDHFCRPRPATDQPGPPDPVR